MAVVCQAPDASSQRNVLSKNTLEVPTRATGEILGVQFSPSGRTIACCSADKTIRLNSVYGNNELLLVLKGHKGAVLQCRWAAEGDRIFSCSVDCDASVWDLTTGCRIKRLSGHEEIVNTCAAAKRDHPNLLVTGSDDGNTMLWDLRINQSAVTFPGRYQVLSVAYDEGGYRVFSGSLDNQIRIFDVRSVVTSPINGTKDETLPAQLFSLKGHVNAITGIALSDKNEYLVSNAMDQTVRLWDVRPFCSQGEDNRCLAITKGPTHNFEQVLQRVNWHPQNLTVGVGSADRTSYIISFEGVESRTQEPQLLYRLPGHTGTVTEVDFHPHDNLIVTASIDRSVLLKKLS
ncbi:U5 small nuclear ribonucleoprotein 40 kDa protein-like [Hylaeus volcanicus]|uniref:U5 small nuclear ribonucleoprotein 40 kDa protein-like n=1 Tax=Hylaeus volcanicus TaxID=313075 RepID=UPI0023B85F0C|nr:U5 small nuclear ribonucleoprotein 40 kDa protein-like [Hylaeus volcanicus]